jgi:hypothetical protein
MAEWTTLKSNGLPGGVRYRNHPTRKHGAVPDRYYQIRYRRNGKRYADAIGWASNGVTPKKCYDILLELHENHIIGKGPTTLAEKRLRKEPGQANNTILTRSNDHRVGFESMIHQR